MTRQPKRLLDQVRDATRLPCCRRIVLALSYDSIEKTYVYWAKHFILHHDKRRRLEKEISAFLANLAVEGNGAASTQNQALSALLFPYREALRKDLDLPIELARSPATQGSCAAASVYSPSVLDCCLGGAIDPGSCL